MANTHSINFEAASSQQAAIADASQTGLDISSGDFTISAWVKLTTSPGSNTHMVIAAKWSTANQANYRLSYFNDGGTYKLYMLLSSNGSNTEARGVAQTLTEGVWYHIAAITTAGVNSTEFVVNGVSIGTATGSFSGLFDGTSPFTVGGDGGSYLDGRIDNLCFYNTALTVSQVASRMRTENISDSALKGFWLFNNGLTDISGNSNTLTGANSPTFVTDVPFTTDGVLDTTSRFW